MQDIEANIMNIVYTIVNKDMYDKTRDKLSNGFETDDSSFSMSSLSLLNDVGIDEGSYVESFNKLKESTKGIYKKENSNKIYEIMKENGKMTRDEIVKRANIPRTTVYDCLKEMIFCLDVMKFKRKIRNVRGRPNSIFVLIDNESKIRMLQH